MTQNNAREKKGRKINNLVRKRSEIHRRPGPDDVLVYKIEES
jgi:hypothetical protein